jgi:multidrug resistance efflux pump
MKKNILKFSLLIVILSILVSACGGSATETAEPVVDEVSINEVIAEGRLEPAQGANLFFQARGVVEEVFVQAGDVVSEGDVLVRLANAGAAEAQVVIAQNVYDSLLRNESGDRANLWQVYMNAQIARAEAEEDWEGLNVDSIEDRIEDIEAEIEDLKEDLQDAQDEFDKFSNLDVENSKRKTAEDDLEDAQENLNDKFRELEAEMRERDEMRASYDATVAAEAEAKYQYEITADGPNADQLALAKANLDAAQDALSSYVITAPFGGVVADVNVKVGEQVNAETRAVSVANFDTWIVETTDVTELEVVNIQVGQQVSMIPDALPELQLTGEVVEISEAFTQQGGDILYTVRIKVDGDDERVKWGMTMEVVFLEE